MTDEPEPQTGADQRELARKMQQLVVRAMKDEACRQALLTNPNPLIEDILGIKVPRGVTIVIHEDTATTHHFVLPPRQLPAFEVSDAEVREAGQKLKNTCGGTDPFGGVNMTYSYWPTCNEQLGYC